MKGYTPQQIVEKLRQAELEIGKGSTIKEACRKIGVTDHTYYRWRKQYGGMDKEMAREYKTMQKENTRLRKIVADMTLDMEILREANKIMSKNL